jgi:hypothetical protein
MDPVPDPLLFFSGSAGNRTRAFGSVAKNQEIQQSYELIAEPSKWQIILTCTRKVTSTIIGQHVALMKYCSDLSARIHMLEWHLSWNT